MAPDAPLVFAAPEFDTAREQIPLDGLWQFSYDPDGLGVAQRWFEAGKKLPETIAVPGCSQARAFRSARGNLRVTDVDIPEQSNTVMLRHGCMHPSWYKRTFTVPADWAGDRIHLHVGGVKPAAEFWINGQRLGETTTSRSPVRCDLTPFLRVGQENTLAVRVSWPAVRLEGVWDVWHAWSGLYRHVWVERVPTVWLADVHALTHIEPASVTLHLRVNAPAPAGAITAECAILDPAEGRARATITAATKIKPRGDHFAAAIRIRLADATLWSVNNPHLYKARIHLKVDGKTLDTAFIRFGLREISTRGLSVLLNGKPVFLRGACDDRVYPRTVCPPADADFYRRQIAKAKRYGFNYTKSCIEVYTREYLDAADELGYLVCQEMPFGGVGRLRHARHDPTDELASLWRSEAANIVASDRNHPSVIIYSMASELALNGPNPKPFRIFGRELPAIARRLNPRALVIDVTSAECGARTPHGTRDTDLLEQWIEGCGFQSPLHGPLRLPAWIDRPFILHEWNWITALPDPARIAWFARSPLMPAGVPEMVEAARRNGLAGELPAMVKRSRALKHVLRKDALERAHENPRIAGYHHWLIHDVPYCPEGVFDEWWNEPRDLPAEEFRTYNDDTVLTLVDGPTRAFDFGRPVTLGLTLSHFGEAPLRDTVVTWRLGPRGKPLGRRRVGAVACGSRTALDALTLPPLSGKAPGKFDLIVEVHDGRRRVAWNHWPLWFFPTSAPPRLGPGVYASLPDLYTLFPDIRRPLDPLAPPSDARLFITHRLDDASGQPVEAVFSFLERGGRMLLLSNGVLKERESCAYRTLPYNQGRVGNMGTVIRPHPALGDFPHEGWCDLPFVPLIEGAYPIDLAAFAPTQIRPIIRSNGHYVTMEDKGYLFEVGVGKGVLMVCSLNLQMGHTHPAGRCLLHAMLRYLNAGRPRPGARITREQLKAARAGAPGRAG